MQGSPTFLTGTTGLDLLATATQADARVAIGSPAFAGDGTATITTNSIIRSQVDSSGNVSSTIPGGSVLLPEFKIRAWINCDGVPTVPSILGSGNISSVTKLSTGQYRVNFITAMPDANYGVCLPAVYVPGVANPGFAQVGNNLTTTPLLTASIDCSIFRNDRSGFTDGPFFVAIIR